MAQQSDRPTPSFPPIWLQVTEIQVVESPGHARNAEHVAWLPPDCPQGFDVREQSPWHILDPNNADRRRRLVPVPGTNGKFMIKMPKHIKHYDKISMVFTTELNSFFEVPYSCIDEHVSARRERFEADGWHRITFVKPEDETMLRNHPNLWMIGHGHRQTQMDSSVNITDPWNNLLLPGSFANGVQGKNTLPTCELAGRLTMILGLVAFATSPNDLFGMVRDSFRPSGTSHYVPTWATQRLKDCGIIHKRGLIVEIAFDPQSCRAEDIEAWEHGFNGPILTSPQQYNL